MTGSEWQAGTVEAAQRAGEDAKSETSDSHQSIDLQPSVRLGDCGDPGWRFAVSSYRLSRSALIVALRQDASLLNQLKAAVWALARRELVVLPRLAQDRPEAWLWRYEFLTSFLDAELIEMVRRIAPTCRWALDGGAHVGYVTRAISKANPGIRTFAVEAHPLNAVALRSNALGRTEVIGAALDSKVGTALLYEGTGHSNSSLSDAVVGRQGGAYAVPSTTIDRVVPAATKRYPGLIKLDLEGFEFDALKGAEDLLSINSGLAILIEINPRALERRGLALDAATALLQSFGYVGRQLLQSFALADYSRIDERRAGNYLFLHSSRWGEWLNQHRSKM